MIRLQQFLSLYLNIHSHFILFCFIIEFYFSNSLEFFFFRCFLAHLGRHPRKCWSYYIFGFDSHVWMDDCGPNMFHVYCSSHCYQVGLPFVAYIFVSTEEYYYKRLQWSHRFHSFYLEITVILSLFRWDCAAWHLISFSILLNFCNISFKLVSSSVRISFINAMHHLYFVNCF